MHYCKCRHMGSLSGCLYFLSAFFLLDTPTRTHNRDINQHNSKWKDNIDAKHPDEEGAGVFHSCCGDM